MDLKFKLYLKDTYKGHKDKVILSGQFSKYNGDYNELRVDIVKNVKKNKIVAEFSKDEKFVLEFVNENKISGLDCIFNVDSYKYFLGLTQIYTFPSNQVKLLLKILKKNEDFPIFKPPQYENVLTKSLTETMEQIKTELNSITNSDLIKTKKNFYKNIKEGELFHGNIVCNNCLNANFYGDRYMCCECDNVNLCENCWRKQNHEKEHTFIKITKPILLELDEYNNSFVQNELFFKNEYGNFQIEIEIINVGEKDLMGCFILPIRYSKKYLGCLKKTITDEFKVGEKKKINLNIILGEQDENIGETDLDSQKIYEGYFRMYTKEGLPFGEVLYVKIMNEN